VSWGWHHLPGRFILALRDRSEGSMHEYHAELYRGDGYEDLDEIAEAYAYNTTHLGVTLTLDSMEHRWEIHLGLPGATFGLRGGKPRYPSREREYGWKFHHGTLWLLGGRSPDESSRDDPWWWEQTVDLKRLLFGRIRHEKRELGEHRAVVSLPEGDYPVTVVLTESRWWSERPLLGRFVSRRMRRAEVTPDTPIPEPGKGENAYDIEDDAMQSLSTPAETVQEALDAVLETVMETRWRHGGLGWEPRDGWPQEVIR
jgi:hypothetical protein